jgi:hypothetical protein
VLFNRRMAVNAKTLNLQQKYVFRIHEAIARACYRLHTVLLRLVDNLRGPLEAAMLFAQHWPSQSAREAG